MTRPSPPKPPRGTAYWASRRRIEPRDAVRLQVELAGLVRQEPLPGPVKLIAGADVAFTPDGESCVASVVVMTWPGLEFVEASDAVRPLDFPYVPGLLSFRELPAVVQAARGLTHVPDVLLVDGQGIAHPRRFGVAAHVGVELDWPTIGCAKSRLTGVYREPGPNRPSRRQLRDEASGEVIGTVVRTRTGVKPVFVSVGHRISLDQAVRIVLRSCRGFRLPEPARAAHQRVTRLRAVPGYGQAR